MKISESGAKCWLRGKKGVLVHDKVFAGFPPSRAMRDSATRKLQAAAESILRAPRVLEGHVIWQVPWGIFAREWVLRGGWGFLGCPGGQRDLAVRFSSKALADGPRGGIVITGRCLEVTKYL